MPTIAWATVTLLSLTAMLAMASGQSQLDPFPAWGSIDGGWVRTIDPPGTQYAPEIDLVDRAFFSLQKAGEDSLRMGRLHLGHRTNNGVIAVWEWDTRGGTRSPLGGIDTGLDRLIYVGFSSPGSLFARFDRVLMWSGFDSANKQVIGFLPIVGSKLDVSKRVLRRVAAPKGGVWVCVSMLQNGIAALDGVHCNLRWVENGTTFHSGIAIYVPRDLRGPVRRIDLNSDGEVELFGWPTMGLGVKRRIVDVASNRVIAKDPYQKPAPAFPALYHPVAGLEALEIRLKDHTGARVRLEVASSRDGPWTPLSAPIQTTAAQYAIPVPLSRALAQGEWIRAVDLRANTVGYVLQVRRTDLVVSHNSLFDTPVLRRGAPLTIKGGNFLDVGGVAPSVSTDFGAWVVSSASKSSVTVVVPAQHPFGVARLKISNSLGAKLLVVGIRR